MKEKLKNLINKVTTTVKNIFVNNKAKVLSVATIAAGATSLAYCANDLENLVNKVGTLAFGVLELVGAIILVLGIVAFGKSMTGDDDNGADQNATSKGIKKIIAGALMVFGPLLVLGWIGATPTTLGTKFFGGL